MAKTENHQSLYFDFPDPENLCAQRNPVYFTNPVCTIEEGDYQTTGLFLEQVDRWVKKGYYLAGYLPYRFATEELKTRLPFDQGWFGVFKNPETLPANTLARQIPFFTGPVVPGENFQNYKQSFEKIKEKISNGYLYQANYTFFLHFPFWGSFYTFFEKLSKRQGAGYHALIDLGEGALLSLSPELFFYRNGTRWIMKPMKGTLERSGVGKNQGAEGEKLKNSGKDRAENMMIVDLIRNDMGVVSVPGSVEVEKLLSLEDYQTLFQLTSTVGGQLRENTPFSEIIGAVFPGGSITGAPKKEAIGVLDDLEKEQRGVYTGAIGYITPDNKAVFNIAIRTVEIHKTDARMGVGSGIVFDSDPEGEYRECLLKGKFLEQVLDENRKQFALIESLICRNGRPYRLNKHLRRLAASASFFRIPFDPAVTRERLLAHAAGLGKGGYKLRALLHPNGSLDIAETPVVKEKKVLKLKVVAAGIAPDDIFIRHKTTFRERYLIHYKEAIDQGYDEVVFVNTTGNLTEATNYSVFCHDGGRWVTPPLHDGVLDGVYRATLLEKWPGRFAQNSVPVRMLRPGAELLLTNSVRGFRKGVVTYIDEKCFTIDS